jgi:hypothetical protein
MAGRAVMRRKYQKKIFGADFMTKVALARREPRWARYSGDAEYEAAMALAMLDHKIGELYWDDAEITVVPPGERVFVVWYDPEWKPSPLSVEFKQWKEEATVFFRNLK